MVALLAEVRGVEAHRGSKDLVSKGDRVDFPTIEKLPVGEAVWEGCSFACLLDSGVSWMGRVVGGVSWHQLAGPDSILCS